MHTLGTLGKLLRITQQTYYSVTYFLPTDHRPTDLPTCTYLHLLAGTYYLQAKAPGIRRTHLPFVGRNVVLWRGAAAAEDSAAPSGPLCEECLP